MLKISDKKFFCEILADALVQTYLTCADKTLRELWINAFAQAAATILEGDTAFFHWDPHEKLLLVWSAGFKQTKFTAIQAAISNLLPLTKAFQNLVTITAR